jgi:hypothetical protein
VLCWSGLSYRCLLSIAEIDRDMHDGATVFMMVLGFVVPFGFLKYSKTSTAKHSLSRIPNF